MKKLLVFSMVFVSFVSYAQIQKLELPKEIKVGEIKPMGTFIVDLTYYVSELDNVKNFSLTYRNGKYITLDDYKTIKFKGDDETITSLYNVFHDAFKTDDIKSYEQTIKLGDELITIKGYKMMGIKGVQFLTKWGWLNPINESQLNKLFGK